MSKTYEESVKRKIKGEKRKKVQMEKCEYNELGQEVLDPQPVYYDIGFKEPPSLDEKLRSIATQIKNAARAEMEAANLSRDQVEAMITEENNFDIPDEEVDLLTPYEAQGLVTELEEEGVLDLQETPSAEEPVTPAAEEVVVSEPSSEETTPAT